MHSNDSLNRPARQPRCSLSFLYAAGADPSPSVRIAVFRTLAYMRLGGSRSPLVKALDALANERTTLAQVEAIFDQVPTRDRRKLLRDVDELCWGRTR